MSSPAISIDFSESVADAVEKMKENKISSLPALKNTNLKGIIFYRDIIEKGVDPKKEIFNLIKQPQPVISSKGILKVSKDIVTSSLKALPVLEDNKLVGIISRHDIVKQIAESEEFKDIKIKFVMSQPPITISKKSSLLKARSLMLENDIRRLPVLEDNKLVGIITLTDIAKKIYQKGRSEKLLSLPVKKVASAPVETVNIEDSIALAAKKTIENDISGLPVMDDGKLVGIVTQLDLVKEVAKL